MKDDRSFGEWFNENGVDDYDGDGDIGFFDKVMDKRIYQSILNNDENFDDPFDAVGDDDDDDF